MKAGVASPSLPSPGFPAPPEAAVPDGNGRFAQWQPVSQQSTSDGYFRPRQDERFHRNFSLSVQSENDLSSCAGRHHFLPDTGQAADRCVRFPFWWRPHRFWLEVLVNAGYFSRLNVLIFTKVELAFWVSEILCACVTTIAANKTALCFCCLYC